MCLRQDGLLLVLQSRLPRKGLTRAGAAAHRWNFFFRKSSVLLLRLFNCFKYTQIIEDTLLT